VSLSIFMLRQASGRSFSRDALPRSAQEPTRHEDDRRDGERTNDHRLDNLTAHYRESKCN
jgi:hypothetical protein